MDSFTSLRRARSNDPRLSPRGPLVQLEGAFAESVAARLPPASPLASPALLAREAVPAATVARVLDEAHSSSGAVLAARQPDLAAAVIREVRQGVQKFHDGAYGGCLDSSQKRLAEDIYQQLTADKDGAFFGYRDKILNFSVAVGPIAYDGPLPCFCYNVAYPQKWTQNAWIAVFFTLKEDALRSLDLVAPEAIDLARRTEALRPASPAEMSMRQGEARQRVVDMPTRPVLSNESPTRPALSAEATAATRAMQQPGDSLVSSTPQVTAETYASQLERSRTYSRHSDPLRSARLLDPPASITQATDSAAFAESHFGNPLKSGDPRSRVETKGYRDINGDLITTRIDQATGERTVSVQDSLGRVRSSSRPTTPRPGDRCRSQSPLRKTVSEQCLDEFRSPAWRGRGDALLAGRTLWPRTNRNVDDPLWNRPTYMDHHVLKSSRHLDDPLWRRSMTYLDDPLRRRSPPYLENPLWSRRSPTVGLV